MTAVPRLLSRYAAVVCDLDGVVYRGPTAVPYAVDTLAGLDVPVLYATNNASRPPADVAEHLRRLGLPCVPEAVATSSQAGAWLLVGAAGTVDSRARRRWTGGGSRPRGGGPHARARVHGRR